jgi:hypothetical protein
MSTSGTVATTVISTDTLVDHAIMRVGKSPAVQTPQVVQTCQESLYMLLLSLSNRGLNLWAVERELKALIVGQPTYVMAAGTLDVLNVVYSQPTFATTVVVASPGITTATATTSSTGIRVGVTFNSAYVDGFYIAVDSAPVQWVPAASYQAGLYWFDLDKAQTGTVFSVSGTVSLDVSDLSVVTLLRDVPLTPLNRDSFMALPNKAQQSHPCVNYWFEKKLNPQITLWPVPDNTNDHLTLMRHRQVQDVGTLSQQIEIPARWYEAITWQLSLRLAFELPDVAPDRIQLVNSMAGQYLLEDELGETDSMPSSIQPNIRPYTA